MVEESFLCRAARRLRTKLAQFLPELALLRRKLRRHDDVHDDDLVAATRRTEARHALAAKPDQRRVLRAGGYFERVHPVHGRHLKRTAEGNERGRDAKLVEDVLATPLEQLMGPHAHLHVQVARRTPAIAGLAFA